VHSKQGEIDMDINVLGERECCIVLKNENDLYSRKKVSKKTYILGRTE
jgi:hypothetical protein